MVPTGGPHLSASEREREGEAGPLDARWAAQLKLGCKRACGLRRREGGPAGPERGRGEGREVGGFGFFSKLFFFSFQTFLNPKHF
jgi:hypothetical protein